MFFESLSRHIPGAGSEKHVTPSSIIVSTALEVLWEHRANLTSNFNGAPSLADLRQQHFEWIRDRLAELEEKATHGWQYSLLLESLESYSDLFELLYAGTDVQSSAFLTNLSLCARDIPANSFISSLEMVDNGATDYAEEVAVLAKKLLSLRDDSKRSVVSMLESMDFSQCKFEISASLDCKSNYLFQYIPLEPSEVSYNSSRNNSLTWT